MSRSTTVVIRNEEKLLARATLLSGVQGSQPRKKRQREDQLPAGELPDVCHWTRETLEDERYRLQAVQLVGADLSPDCLLQWQDSVMKFVALVSSALEATRDTFQLLLFEDVSEAFGQVALSLQRGQLRSRAAVKEGLSERAGGVLDRILRVERTEEELASWRRRFPTRPLMCSGWAS